MDKWPPSSIDPRDPDWIRVPEAAHAACTTEKAIYANIRYFGVYWFGRCYVSRERLLSTAWSKPAIKKKGEKDQLDLGI